MAKANRTLTYSFKLNPPHTTHSGYAPGLGEHTAHDSQSAEVTRMIYELVAQLLVHRVARTITTALSQNGISSSATSRAGLVGDGGDGGASKVAAGGAS